MKLSHAPIFGFSENHRFQLWSFAFLMFQEKEENSPQLTENRSMPVSASEPGSSTNQHSISWRVSCTTAICCFTITLTVHSHLVHTHHGARSVKFMALWRTDEVHATWLSKKRNKPSNLSQKINSQMTVQLTGLELNDGHDGQCRRCPLYWPRCPVKIPVFTASLAMSYFLPWPSCPFCIGKHIYSCF